MNHLSRRSFLKTAAFAAPAIVGMNSLVRAQSAREGKLGIALCGLGGFSKQSIAPELPSAQNVYFAGAITGNAAKGREWAAQYGFSEKNIFSYADMAKLADGRAPPWLHRPARAHAADEDRRAGRGRGISA
jgi:glucose-fructose oxidoreductase